jgi:hypothetical protein
MNLSTLHDSNCLLPRKVPCAAGADKLVVVEAGLDAAVGVARLHNTAATVVVVEHSLAEPDIP